MRLGLADHVAAGEDPQPGVDVHGEHDRAVEPADGVVVPAAKHHAGRFSDRVDPESNSLPGDLGDTVAAQQARQARVAVENVAITVDEVAAACDEGDRRILQERGLGGETVRADEIVGTHHLDQLPTGLPDGCAPVGRQRKGSFGADVSDARVVEPCDHATGAVGRAVVPDHHLKVCILARQHRPQGRRQGWCALVDRDTNGNVRSHQLLTGLSRTCGCPTDPPTRSFLNRSVSLPPGGDHTRLWSQ